MRQNPISRSFFRLVTRLIIGEDDFAGIMGLLAVGHVVAVTSEPSSHHFLPLIRRYIKYFNRHYFGCTLRGRNSFLLLCDWFLFFNASYVLTSRDEFRIGKKFISYVGFLKRYFLLYFLFSQIDKLSFIFFLIYSFFIFIIH